MMNSGIERRMTRAAFNQTQAEIARFGKLMCEAFLELSAARTVDTDAVPKAARKACVEFLRTLNGEGKCDGQSTGSIEAA
jgi:hypothetical protein